jgi:hypothetical protein
MAGSCQPTSTGDASSVRTNRSCVAARLPKSSSKSALIAPVVELGIKLLTCRQIGIMLVKSRKRAVHTTGKESHE